MGWMCVQTPPPAQPPQAGADDETGGDTENNE